MKLQHYFAAAAVLGLAACSSDEAVTPAAKPTTSPVTAPAPTPRYLALPGQAAVAVTADVDAAFDQQAAAYANAANATTTPTVSPAINPVSGNPAVSVATTPASTEAPIIAPIDPDPTAATDVTAPSATPAATTPTSDASANADVTASTGNMNYKVRITNGTEGRLFIEAQDAAGTIYPCGFMEGSRTFTTPLDNAAPIKGPITIVVRDPDQPSAPEIRRYKVDPPAADYNGKAIGITVLPGGRYTATLDGQTYYASPAAIPTPSTPKPANEPAGE